MLSSKKQSVEKILEPLIGIFANVSPNTLTFLGIIPSVLFFVFIVSHFYELAIIAFLGNFFDFFDGMVARKYHKVTAFGGFLDSTMDRIADFLVITAFSFGGIVRWEITAPLLLVSYLTSYMRSRGELAKKQVSFAIGIIERTERLLLIILALVLCIFFPHFSVFSFTIAELVFIFLTILSAYTVWQRGLHAYNKLN